MGLVSNDQWACECVHCVPAIAAFRTRTQQGSVRSGCFPFCKQYFMARCKRMIRIIALYYRPLLCVSGVDAMRKWSTGSVRCCVQCVLLFWYRSVLWMENMWFSNQSYNNSFVASFFVIAFFQHVCSILWNIYCSYVLCSYVVPIVCFKILGRVPSVIISSPWVNVI